MSALFLGRGASGFDRLYERHAASVYRYVYAVLGNHSDAEDVTQQTFLNAYRAMAQGTKPRKAENWLLTIAHNEVRRYFRRTHGRPLQVELDDRLEHPEPEDADPSLADVLRALQHLPPAQRAAIVMREFEGRSYAEIAEILDVTTDALEGLIFRARRGLAEQLEGALTCVEAEDALLRRLDARLPRRESRRLKQHLHECPACVRFSTVQKRQRSLLKGLSVLPIPASLYLFRGEQAALAAVGAGTATAAGGTAASGGGAALATGAFGFAVKAAAVTASAAVVGGVGYGVATGPATAAKTERKAAHAAAVEQTRLGRRAADVRIALAQGVRPGPAAPANARARLKGAQAKGRFVAATKRLLRETKARAARGPTKDTTKQRAKGRATSPSRGADALGRAKAPANRGRATGKRPRRPKAVPARKRPAEPGNAAVQPADRGKPPRDVKPDIKR